MNEVRELIAFIKRQLKAQGITYRDVAHALQLSEPSVKRLFSNQRFTVERLAQISALLGFTLAEVMHELTTSLLPEVTMLTVLQERELISDILLLLVAVCAFNHWSIADIVANYRLSEAYCLRYLLRLDRMGVLTLLPGNRIRLRIARDFDWLPNGPISQFFREENVDDFLSHRFHQDHESMSFVHGMLTEGALTQLQREIGRLRRKFACLHQESIDVPLKQKRGVGMLVATREWEPSAFKQYRRGHGDAPVEESDS